MAGNNGGQNQQNQNNSQQKSGLSWSQPQNPIPGQKSADSTHVPYHVSKTPMTPPTKSNSGSKTTTFVIAAVVGVVIVGGIVISQRNKAVPDAAVTATTTSDGASYDVTSPRDTGTVASNVSLATPTITPTSTALPNDTINSTGSGITVASPQGAGMQVEISNIVASVPTWVIVYENRNGQPGNVLGAALFGIGPTSGMVELLRTTTSGSTYYVATATDDGDRVFSMKNDAAVRDANNTVVTTQFKTN